MRMQSGEVFEMLEGHLKSTDEIDLVVLRGHLILEQCLNAMLVQWIPAERLPKLNLNFAGSSISTRPYRTRSSTGLKRSRISKS